jgi:hypothetical protein
MSVDMKSAVFVGAVVAAAATDSRLNFEVSGTSSAVSLVAATLDDLTLTCASSSSNLCEMAATKADVATLKTTVAGLVTTVAGLVTSVATLETTSYPTASPTSAPTEKHYECETSGGKTWIRAFKQVVSRFANNRYDRSTTGFDLIGNTNLLTSNDACKTVNDQSCVGAPDRAWTRAQWTLDGTVAVGTVGRIIFKDDSGAVMTGTRLDFATDSDYFNTGRCGHRLFSR